MELRRRSYASDEDAWRIRAFLRRLLLASELHPSAWHVLRWDYWRTHGVHNCGGPAPELGVTIWETRAGEIAAVVNPENPGEAFLQLDPAARSEELEAEMLAAAEERIAVAGRLLVWAEGSDAGWTRALERAGYRPTADDEHQRARSLRDPLPAAPPVPGYRIRPLGGDEDFPARGELSLRVFHPVPDGSTAMSAADYRWVQLGPLYRRDLDLVAEADDGSLAAFATFWVDDVTRTVVIEPVGTDAPHRRRGLGRALLLEGMARARQLGAVVAYVGSYGAEAHGLYASVGLETVDHLIGWSRPAR
jgi:GNAT superfamily N-acetyltransferase